MIPLIAQIGAERLDWFGFGISSANRTAAFIACAIIASWMFAAVFKKIGFWISIVLSLMLFYFLIQTQSRGALVALAIALAIFFAVGKIEYTKSRILVLVAALVVVGCFYFQSSLSTRMSNMAALQSSSANCRADIYLSGIKMLTDAPHGFPSENSPVEIYMRWYQNPDDSETYISMINSHLEFMCRYGFLGSMAYILFWSFVLCITFPAKRDALSAAAFATCICFGLCAAFSNIMNYWVLWIIPFVMIVVAILRNKERFRSKKFYHALTILSLGTLLLIYSLSYALPRDCKLSFLTNGDVICGNKKTPKYLLYMPLEKTVGARYGGELTQFCKENNEAVLVSKKISDGEFDTALICEISNDNELSKIHAKRKILLNTRIFESVSGCKDENVVIYIGLLSDWRNRNAWIKVAENNTKIKVIMLDGIADYIPNWTNILKDEYR